MAVLIVLVSLLLGVQFWLYEILCFSKYKTCRWQYCILVDQHEVTAEAAFPQLI